MGLFRTVAVVATAAIGLVQAEDAAAEWRHHHPRTTLTADVVVLGGGSAGTYGAIALKDKGKNVIVVEAKNRLGGHFETYSDPSGTPVDYGVQVILNNAASQAFFARFQEPVQPFVPPSQGPMIRDFTTGQTVAAVPFSNFAGYNAQVSQYSAYLNNGDQYPNPPPADFSLPFGQFITKYGLQSEAFAIYNSPACTGVGNIMNQPTLTVFRCLNTGIEAEAAPGGAFVPVNHNYSSLFAKAQAELGSNVLLSSWVVGAARPAAGSKNPTTLWVYTPSGVKVIQTKQILVAFPQTQQNMWPLGLDGTESDIFRRFVYTAWYTGLIKNTGLSPGETLNAGANTPDNIPQLPGVYVFLPTAVSGLFNFWYGSDYPVSQGQVQGGVNDALAKLTGKPQSPQTVAYADHTPYNLHFGSSDIQAGYWTKFSQLQGYRNTYYTGAVLAFPTGIIWSLTQQIVQNMVAAM